MAPDPLSRVFAALGDPIRRDMVARLALGDASVGELAAPHAVSVQAVSKHLRVLEGAGLIERSRTAQLRPSRLRGEPLRLVDQWLDTYRELWGASFDRLDARLRRG